MAFPISPSNGQQTTVNGIIYEYSTSTNAWTRVPSNFTGIFTITNTTAASSTNTGALQVRGGVGIGGSVFIGGEISVIGTAWTTYTPTWATSGTAPAIGNGTLSGRYKQIGKTVFFQIRFVAGSTTTFGTGNWSFTLPTGLNAQTTNNVVVPTSYLDNGTQYYYGVAINEFIGSTSTITPLYGTGAVTATNPHTWASTDTMTINGSYETA